MTHTTKHTPGPWHTDGWENIVVNDQWGTTILCCPGSSTGTLDEIKANSALIAAAPAMYEALQIMVRAANVDEIDPLVMFASIERAKGALAQAEGRG